LKRWGARVMGSASLAGSSILIVEDEALIALDLRHSLESAGAHVFAVTQVANALLLAHHPELSAAVLDYRIGEETSVHVCQHLQQRGVPFLFYSGHEDVRGEWPRARVLSKPASSQAIVDAVAGLLEEQPRRMRRLAPRASIDTGSHKAG